MGLLANDKNLDNDAKAQLIKILRENKTYGLVWEHNPEEAYELLRSKLPVFTEDKSKFISSEDPSAPNHILIEGDNLHALHTLCFTHEGKFDLIYIDPPYNSGATDWRYNNDYVDGSDSYRHSKWLSMMENRLRIAKKLLNPINSVLIVTIDEKEYLRLGFLLEELFPTQRIQMISTNIHPGGVARDKAFARSDEYIYFVFIGESGPQSLPLEKDWLFGIENTSREGVHWRGLLRSGSNDSRQHSPGCFYPIYVSEDGTKICKIGEPLDENEDRLSYQAPEGQRVIFPIHANGSEGCWQCSPNVLRDLISKGYVKLGGFTERGMSINYLAKGEQKKIESGLFKIIGRNLDGSLIIDDQDYKARFIPTTQWCIKSHDALRNGTCLLNNILGPKAFPYPKSLYAVHDTIRFFVDDNPNALILDFFAGSGTTMHATMMLNQEDGGHRTCYLVTNNENNICEEVTYERNKRVIQGYTTPKGVQVEGLKGNTLRYFRTELLDRALTHQNKKALFSSLVDTLRIKENCFTEQSTFGSVSLEGKDRFLRYFAEGDRKLLVVFDSKIIPLLVKEIEAMPLEDNALKLYIFSDGSHPYTAEFEPVLDKIDLVAMPNAIISALKYVLPSQTDAVVDENTLTPDELAAELQAATEAENHEQN